MNDFFQLVIIVTVVFGGFGLFVIWIGITGRKADKADEG